MQFPYLSHFVRYTITKNFTGKHRLGHKPTDTGTSFEGQSKSLHFIVCNWRSFKQTKRKSAGTCIETYLTWWTGLSIVTRKLTSLRRFLIREEAKFWLPKTHIEVVYKLLHFSEVVVVPINKVTNKHSTLQSPDPDKNTHTPSWFLLVTFKASLRQLLRVSKHCCTVGNIPAREISIILYSKNSGLSPKIFGDFMKHCMYISPSRKFIFFTLHCSFPMQQVSLRRGGTMKTLWLLSYIISVFP